MPQKLAGSITASFRYSRLSFFSAIKSLASDDGRRALIWPPRFNNDSGVRLARPGRQRRRLLLPLAEEPHAALVFEQLVLQLHVHRLALDLLHLRVHARGAQLELGLGRGGAAVDLVAHLVEGRGVVAQLERGHRLRELLLELGLLRLVDELHRLGGAPLHLEDVVVAGLPRLFGCARGVVELLAGLREVELRLLELPDVGRRDVVAVHLDGGLDLRVEVYDLLFEAVLVLGEQALGGHHLRDRVVQLRHAVAHVADGLLEYQLGVFRLLDDAPEHRAQTALQPRPDSHRLLALRTLAATRRGCARKSLGPETLTPPAGRRHCTCARAAGFTRPHLGVTLTLLASITGLPRRSPERRSGR